MTEVFTTGRMLGSIRTEPCQGRGEKDRKEGKKKEGNDGKEEQMRKRC